MANPIDPNEYQDPKLKELLDLLQPVPPRDEVEAYRTRSMFLAEVDALFEAVPEQQLSWQERLRRTLRLNLGAQKFAFSTLAVLVVAFLLLFGGAGATALAAQSALPGDALYGVKTSLESARLSLAADAFAQGQLHLGFAERRLDEIARLIAAGRSREISAAAAEFSRQINLALQNLQLLSANDPLRAAELARQITDALSRYAQALASLTAAAPETVRPALEQALQLSQDAASGEIELTGVVEAITPEQWTISGKTVLLSPSTEIKGQIRVGDSVKAHATLNQDGTYTAREIELAAAGSGDTPADNSGGNNNTAGDDENNNENTNDNLNEGDDQHSGETRFIGIVESISAGIWTVSGQTLLVNAQTDLESSVSVGDLVEVRAVRGADGRLVAVRLRKSGESSNENSSGNSQDNDNESGNDNTGKDGDEDDDEDSSGSGSGGSNDDSNDDDDDDNSSSGEDSGSSGSGSSNDDDSNDNDD